MEEIDLLAVLRDARSRTSNVRDGLSSASATGVRAGQPGRIVEFDGDINYSIGGVNALRWQSRVPELYRHAP